MAAQLLETPYYGSFWGYYGYGWNSVYDPGYVRDDRVISLETLIFSVPKNVLLWAGMSETENPKNAAAVVAEVVKEAAKEIRSRDWLGRGGFETLLGGLETRPYGVVSVTLYRRSGSCDHLAGLSAMYRRIRFRSASSRTTWS